MNSSLSKPRRRKSPFARIGNAVLLRSKPAVIIDVEEDYCLVRIGNGKGGWNKPKWIENHEWSITGTPPKDMAVAWRREIMRLPLASRPRLRRTSLQAARHRTT